jgi:DNA-binding LacI/PurR family transcriptional regulator
MKDPADDNQQKPARPPALHTPSLKQLAEYLGLNPATVSVVLNEVPGRSIPQATRDRIRAAAQQLNDQPNLLARSLRSRRTLTIGILPPESGDGYHTQVMSGVGDQLIKAGYFYFTAHHRHKRNLIEEYTRMLIGRGAQGIVAIDTHLGRAIGIPVVCVAGHRRIEGVTNVLLAHVRAAELTLNHLYSLGHRHIAFMRGQPFSSDSDDRWKSLVAVAERLGIEMKTELIINLERDLSSPQLGYPVIQQLLASKEPFTALVAFNDILVIGAIRALRDVNLRLPEDLSVIGFDDVKAASYSLPRLTTINQPLEEIGRIATQCLLNRIHNTMPSRDEITVEPELIIRESTGPVKS